jgi:predicted transposase YbfD/YdcC
MSSSTTISSARIPLSQVFATVPDPRARRGVRHTLPVVLTVAAAAVLAGAKSLLAVGEWVAEADRDALSRLGIDQAVVLPSESTIRRTLAGLDADDLDARLGAWMATRVRRVGERAVIAVDGKSLRGASVDGARPHLLAALDHDHRVVLGQRAVADKGSEIPALKVLLASMDLTGAVVTADALHCQRDTATWLVGAGAHYVLTVKGNQPRLRNALKDLPWAKVPGHTYRDRRHGRAITRTVKAVQVPAWVDWPGAAQVLQVRRTRIVNGGKQIEVVYAVSSVPMEQAPPRVVAAWIQGHWGIENALHWVRDVTFDEDRHQLRVGVGPQVMATLRNTGISLLRLAGWASITAGLRHHARDSRRPIKLLAES